MSNTTASYTMTAAEAAIYDAEGPEAIELMRRLRRDLPEGTEIYHPDGFVADLGAAGWLEWGNDCGSARVPDTPLGRAWIERANEIQSRPETAANVEAWDAHSLALDAIGGEWF